MTADSVSTASAPPYAGYGAGAIGPGRRPAVVVVDFQPAFTTDALGMGGGPMFDPAVEKTARLLERARSLGVPVVQTVVSFRPDGADLGLWAAKMPALRELVIGSPLAQVDPRLADDRDIVLRKLWPSAFHSTPLDSFLRVRGVDTVIVCGCTTSGCVRATVVDAFSDGYRVLLPVDAVADHDPEPHESNLRDCARRYCDLTSAEDVVAYLDRLGVAR